MRPPTLNDEVKQKQNPEELSTINSKNLTEFESYLESLVKKAVKRVLFKSNNSKSPAKLTKIIVNEYPFDVDELRNHTIDKLNENPEIPNINLKISLLKKVANNKKYKKIAQIAQNMLDKEWWKNNE
ncbi:hypothetical protein GKZ89_11850 [Bacillus mangrovi]|uniref:Uncharacterized protein n=1 Tax=Metabacillus mangrovi TaxID=1491830 RepID=A0A7X2V5I9_9BACI|nr:hypothetical protein [Metabacillus mangrovi]MTH54103.1 hypothetical protein [Metabacillus mangrovi]